MFEKIAYYYKKGIYKTSHLQAFVVKGIITQNECGCITGTDEKQQILTSDGGD